MSIVSRETRRYHLVSGHGRWATRSEVAVECVEERGTFYASMNTLNASAIGTGRTADDAFNAWALRCGNAQPVMEMVERSAPSVPSFQRSHQGMPSTA